jgi:hypothetical protein
VAKKKKGNQQNRYASTPYTQVPDGLWTCKEFNELSPHSRCIFMIMLSRWRPYEPDKPISLTYDEIQGITRFNRNRISSSIKQLWTHGFIDIPKMGCYPRNVTMYKVEHKWLEKKYLNLKPNPDNPGGCHGT